MELINWTDFEKVEIRIGTIIKAELFPEAKKPAFRLFIDFGEFGIRKSSAQITNHYNIEDLAGMQVAAVMNFPPKQIGTFMSECLVLGAVQDDGSVILLQAERNSANGKRIA